MLPATVLDESGALPDEFPDTPGVGALLTVLVIEDAKADVDLPCRIRGDDLWFADKPTELERAKALCANCPIRTQCLAGALERQEPWGVWGGEIFERGTIVAKKRARGRPPKTLVAAA